MAPRDHALRPERRLTDLARDGMYVSVGTAVLAFQRLQVLRRDLEKRLGMSSEGFVSATRQDAAEAMRSPGSLARRIPGVEALDARVTGVEDRIDDLLDTIGDRLPTPAQFLLATGRESAKNASAQFRSLIGLTD